MAVSGEQPRTRSSTRTFALAKPVHLQLLAVAAATFWLGYDHGGFQVESRNPFAIGVWWAVLLGVGIAVLPLVRPPVEAVVVAGFLAAFAGWTLASAAWAPSGETALSEFDLVALYVGVFVLTLFASRRATVERWTDGLALGIVALAILAVASRLRPGLIPGSNDLATALPSAKPRLSYPIGYWNGLATLAALGVPLLLRIAVAGRSAVGRPLAVAGIPLLAVTIYLTSSRGGAAAALLAVVVFLALADQRWQTLGALAIAGVGSMLAVAVFAHYSYLTNGGTGSLANSQGRSAAFFLLAVLVGTGTAFALAQRQSARLRLPPAWAGWALAAVVVLGLVGGAIASHPIRRLDHFRGPPTSKVETTTHLLSSAGNGRWEFWSAAADEFAHHPLIGGGAGSYGRWWDRHGSFAYTAQNAHSLFLETLGELGIVGFLLLLGVLVAAGVGIARRIRGRRDRALLVAALTAAFAAYVLSAGIDWMWELPAVTAVAFVILGLLVGPATAEAPQPRLVQSSPQAEPSRAHGQMAPRLLALVLGWLVICALALPLFSQLKISDSQAAARAEDTNAALTAAQAARALEPWAASPYLQLALVQEQAGNLPVARSAIRQAIRRDRTDWRLWLVDARLQMKSGRPEKARADIARIRALNPRSPLLAPLYRFLSP